MASLIVSVKLESSNKIDNVKLDGINLNEKVQNIKECLFKLKQIDLKNFNFIHHGHILEDNEILSEVAIISGSTIFCLPKYNTEVKSQDDGPFNLLDGHKLTVSLRKAVASPNFRVFLQKLRSPEQIEQLSASLKRDAVSLAFITDADLAGALVNAEYLSQIVDKRPAIGRGLQLVCDAFLKEMWSSSSSWLQGNTSSSRQAAASYSLDALSDDDMEVDESGEAPPARRVPSSAAGLSHPSGALQPITPAQLAAALATAAGSGMNPASSSAPLSEPATPLSTPVAAASGSSSPLITTRMFSQALQNALAASASSAERTPRQQQQQQQQQQHPPAPPSAAASDEAESLQLMREMGIADEELSVRALRATGGDVQAAVNLIFAQWMADD